MSENSEKTLITFPRAHGDGNSTEVKDIKFSNYIKQSKSSH